MWVAQVNFWQQPHFTLVVYLDFVYGILNRQKYALA